MKGCFPALGGILAGVGKGTLKEYRSFPAALLMNDLREFAFIQTQEEYSNAGQEQKGATG